VSSRILSDLAAAIAFIAHNAAGAQSGTPATNPLDGTLFHQGLESRCFVSLAGRQGDGHQLAIAFGPDVDLGTEAALAAA
jgi:hypothetical protein